MTIGYDTKGLDVHDRTDGRVGIGPSAKTEGAMPEYPGLSELADTTIDVLFQAEQKKIATQLTKIECQESEAKKSYRQAMNILKEVRHDEEDSSHRTEGQELNDEGAAMLAAAGLDGGCEKEETFETILGGTFATMTSSLEQLLDSVEIERKRLDELESFLERKIRQSLEARKPGSPYTTLTLEARVAVNEQILAAIQSVLELRQRFEERHARLARVGTEFLSSIDCLRKLKQRSMNVATSTPRSDTL